MTTTEALGRYTRWHRTRESMQANGWVLRIDLDGLVWAVPGWLHTRWNGPPHLVPRTDGPSKALLGAVPPNDRLNYQAATRIALAMGWRITGTWTTADRLPACLVRPPATDSLRTVRGAVPLEGETL